MRLRLTGLSWQRIDGDIVVLDLEGSSYLKVNASGAVLWEALAGDEGAQRADLVRLLTERYGIGESQAAGEVDAFLADLEAAGLLDRA